ncbi:MAG: RecX family transcriptional regulator [Spirochaetaceae bacterium]|nr:RecX family transcriptional regulator [Spirochaetaceae bacterium]
MAGKTLTVESVEPGHGTLKLTLNDGSVVTIGTAYLPPELPEAFFCPGAIIADEKGNALDCAAACLAAEQAALRLVARAEQCTAGLSRKLQRRKHEPDAVRFVLDRLTELGLVNDARYAELWLKPRISRGSKGPRMLLAALQHRGIDRKTAGAAMDASLTPDAEAALLRRCLGKSANALPKTNALKREYGEQDEKRQCRMFLKAEGFSAAAIEEYEDSL